ncbi:hypothetical protein B0T14DRAFT_440603 [Immersiella caudata]|uniref:Uncharacterized protein n=1 Tax=Immersiella caudata TaxID=314043 RepID=A0AA39TN95_9PEZI|nr:hypothetical protein B0T14DRAFT_440603 [Immersiella caudata]
MSETVLVVGATGNIGVAALKGALNSGRNVLAIVRNQNSADKLVKHVGTSEGITFIEADITSDSGVRGVVDQVRAGTLPEFQHVYTCVGGEYTDVPLTEVTTERLRYNMNVSFEANFFAYRDTIPYLRAQNHPSSTWTICTGAQGDMGIRAIPAITQGALFSMCVAGSRENLEGNIRFNEVYLAFRVEVDDDAAEHGVVRASDFSSVYELILSSPEVRSMRVRVDSKEDMKTLKYARRF